MKSVLALTALGLAPQAFAFDAVLCSAWVQGANDPLSIHAAVIDIGDQEGELTIYGTDGSIREFKNGYFDGYRTEAGELRHHFVFDFESADQGELNLSDDGTSGTFSWKNLNVPVECTAYDYPGRYVKLAAAYDRKYRDAGSDNNDLAYASQAQPALAIDSQARLITGQEIREAMKSCVFMREGAYGEHIDAAAQNSLVKKFTKDLERLAASENSTLKYFRSDELLADADTLGEPECSLMVEVNGVGTLMLNATRMD